MSKDSLRAIATTKRRLDLYGLTLETFESLIESQGGRCAICKFQYSRRAIVERCALVIDHDHRTGKVRGLLCGRCNSALGMFKDSQGLLIAAAAYLEIPPVDRVVLNPKRRELLNLHLTQGISTEIAQLAKGDAV